MAEKHKKHQNLLKTAEDVVLGYAAKIRYEKSTEKDYIDIEEASRYGGKNRFTPR